MIGPWVKGKIWTKEELAECAAEQAIHNPKYRAAADLQLNEWVKGNNVHNYISPISSVVDEDDNVVGYTHCEGGECCPDFACCEPDVSKHWPLAVREYFLHVYTTQGHEATVPLLMMGLDGIMAQTGLKIYLAGQAEAVKH